MNALAVIEHENKRVLTTQQIAEAYGVDIQKIIQNFNNNKDRYKEGKHYFRITGYDIKKYIEKIDVQNPNMVRALYLWTEYGALMHAKSLNTDVAWEVYEHLVETYFKAREMFSIPKSLPEALRLAAELAEKIEQDKPKVLFADTCMGSGESILIRELAKICSKNGKVIGQNNLFRQLRKMKMLNSNNEPYQEYIDRGYFEVIERPIVTREGTILKCTTKVLPKGQAYIIKHIHGENANE